MKKRILGITGGAGCGKSTVLDYLEKEHGALCLMCDDIARELQKKGGACYGPMLSLLGDEGFLDPEGEFDRARVAKAVFSDPMLLKRLNEIIHPAVRKSLEERIRTSEAPLAVVEAALLLEAGYGDICDEIWYVYASEQTRIRRLTGSRGYTLERCRRVFEAQRDEAYFRSHTDLTIDNDTDTTDGLFEQIDRGLAEHGFLYDSQREQR